MKRKIIVSLICLLLLVGCQTATPADKYKNQIASCQQILENIFSGGVSENIDLPTEMTIDEDKILISWISSNNDIFTNDGTIFRDSLDHQITLTVTLTFSDYEHILVLNVTILKYGPNDLLDIALSMVNLPTVIYGDYLLPDINKTDIEVTWEIKNGLIQDDCLIVEGTKAYNAILTMKAEYNGIYKEKEFMINIQPKAMTNVSYANDWSRSNMENVELINGYLSLQDGHNNGQYISDIIEVDDFKKLVGSWSALTSSTATVNVSFRVRVGGIWSSYLSYSKWGLGLQNKGVSTNDLNGIAKMSTDELMILNNKTANALQFKIYLERSNNQTGPKVSLVAYALDYTNYRSEITFDDLPNNKEYEVPMLNQNIVPIIGNSICSPTSITMLLKYKGEDFSGFDTYEHRYIAGLARDYGHGIYGNWVYNVAVTGAFGYHAYVAQFDNIYELAYHLAYVGPVAISVKGNMQGLYNTSGHLLVVKGYEIVDGKLTFICNDPNLTAVRVNYTQATIEEVWRKICYIVL